MDPFMVSSATLLICAQRLARLLCPHCKLPLEMSKEALLEVGFSVEQIEDPDFDPQKPVGCNRCTNGYKGRFALMETMRMTEGIKRMVVDRAHISDIKTKARTEGMVTLRVAGLANVARGKTSLEEVLRVTMDD